MWPHVVVVVVVVEEDPEPLFVLEDVLSHVAAMQRFSKIWRVERSFEHGGGAVILLVVVALTHARFFIISLLVGSWKACSCDW